MTREYFTYSEAEGLLQTMVRTKVDFSGVPKGTLAMITEKYKASHRDEYGIMVDWVLPSCLRDGFSKNEYDDFLEKVEPCHR